MLPRVLLHEREPPPPINHTPNRASPNRRLQHMRHRVPVVDNLYNPRPAQRAEIKKLSARRRIECRPVQHNTKTVSRKGDGLRIELCQIAVVIVQPFGSQAIYSIANSTVLLNTLPPMFRNTGTFGPFSTVAGIVTLI